MKTRNVLLAVIGFAFILITSATTAQSVMFLDSYNKIEKGFAPEGYTLAWYDEFEGYRLDLDKWFYRDGINRHRTIMARENVIVEHGVLHLINQAGDFVIKPGQYGYQEDKVEFNARGAGIISNWRFSEGYYEASSLIIFAPRWHPAFWLVRANANNNHGLLTTNNRAEIDVYEYESGIPTENSIRLHDFVTGGEHRRLPPRIHMTKSTNQQEGWFAWGMKLTREKAVFYENGKEMITVDMPDDYARNARNIILSSLTLRQPLESGIQRFGWIRFYEPDALRQAERKECEQLIQQTTLVGAQFYDVKHEEASNDYYQLATNATYGDYVRYKVYVSESGKYKITFGGYRMPEDFGQWRLRVNNINVGRPFNQKGHEGPASWDLGTVHFEEPGYHIFEFVCVENTLRRCNGGFDYIELKKSE